MKKLLFGLLGIISLGLINFSSAGSYTYNGNVNRTINANSNTSASTTTVAYMPLPLINLYKGQTTIADQISTVECTISNLDIGIDNTVNNYYFQFDYVMSNGGGNSAVTTPTTFNLTNGTTTYNVQTWNVDGQLYSFRILLSYNRPVSAGYISFDYSCTFSGNNIIDQSKLNIDLSDYELKSNIDQTYCTTNNLCPSSSCDYSDYILKSDVTQNYCELEFNLIDPENCPASGGTGDVQWSAFFVNSHQVEGASNIYLRLPDFLSWDYTYIDSGSTLEIDVENEGDQEYIQSILDIQSYHPDKDQFAQSFAGFLTLLMPYIIITLFIIFVWRLIKRIFR